MTIFQAIVLGIVQGITEFLPVSSSGHLILVPELLGWPEQGAAFDATIHLATLAAVIVALRSDLFQILRSVKDRTATDWRRLGGMLLVATLPVAVFGLLLSEWIDGAFRHPGVVAFSLAFWGVALFFADRFVKPSAVSDVRRVSWKTVIGIGLAQAIALIPGTSRSGVTITAGLASGLNRETAARFSFLLGIPSIALAGAAGFVNLLSSEETVSWIPVLAGFFAAFFTGMLAIRWLLKLLTKASYRWFAFYRVVLAIVVLFVFLR